ncbi:glycerate kinase [Propionivibrio sp.]|uniref:glycerate kinase n=1 Tax=Propionivibrio sp. TaxID=2212460 RepID=UPI0039E42714
MHIVGAPDSCKGSVPATGVAETLERGILGVFPQAAVRKIPIADGGERTVASMVAAAGGEIRAAWGTGPLGERLCTPWESSATAGQR